MIFISTGTPSIFKEMTMCGCRVRRISWAAILKRTMKRMTLRPPVAEPIQPPTKARAKRTYLSNSGQVL